MNLTEISIIVPVYNVENYLKKCLDSIVNQSINKFEVILVEDCSTDKSLSICQEYVEKFDNFKLIKHQKNKGLSAARNSGIKNCNGKYLIFIDSDDWLDLNMVEILYATIQENDCDIVECGFVNVWDNKTTIPQRKEAILTSHDLIIKEYLLSKITAYAFNKIYKKELFIKNQIEYPEGKYYEDQFTTFKLLYNSKKVVKIKTPLYFYNRRQNSITTSSLSAKDLHVIEQLNLIKKFLKQKGEYADNNKYFSVRYFNGIHPNVIKKLFLLSNINEQLKFYKKYIKNDFKENTNNYFFNQNIKFKMKANIFLIRNCFLIYSIIFTYKNRRKRRE
ncbi:glycosyltransferase family 2 protein [Turicibacter sanguinis]|uniref:glycosyltransferase family 2 protein n=1 Tax=Turicibacter sanguinis TaxID=154288 RepID=UPI0018983FA1|nr:glycosyltransferase family 2 protein [Turicibacter sanguinis]